MTLKIGNTWLMAIPLTDIRILFTNYDIIAYFLNLAFCSEHFISIKHGILATFNINQKNSILTACMPLCKGVKRIRMSVGGIAINRPNYKSVAVPKFANTDDCYK
jgi:hypothetical protein